MHFRFAPFYLVEATYKLAGGMTTQTYPGAGGARRSVGYSFDAAGRLASLNSNATSYSNAAASVSGISYAAHGGLSSQTLGNNLLQAINYNSRLQPTAITLGQSWQPSSIFSLSYNYGTTNNNGNLLAADYAGDNYSFSFSQSYSYDWLNRLAAAQEIANETISWQQANNYDRYGNRSVALAGGGQSLSFNNQNQIVGLPYDAAGNVTNDGLHSYAFDAENKIVKLDNVQAYVYDGEGKRVRKLVGENTRFVYGIGGELLAEYNGASGAIEKEYVYGASGLTATIEPTNGTQYITADHLGSPRIVTNASGAVTLRRDFLPFGEEIATGIGGRSILQGYGASNTIRQQYTGYERDAESGLDFAQARYYNYNYGRFTSPDPILNTGRADSPQSWNRYAYAFNNPLIFTDPTGLYICEANPTQCQQFQDALARERANLAKIEKTHGVNSNEYRDAKRALDVYGCGVGDGSGCTAAQANNGVRIYSTTGMTRTDAAGETNPENPTGRDIRVYFNQNDFGNNVGFQHLVAHEGSHAADASEWQLSSFDESKRPTYYATESRAYKVSSLFAQANGDSDLYVKIKPIIDAGDPPPIGNIPLWDKSWAAVDVAKLREKNIDSFLKYDERYNVTPTNPGPKQWVKGRVLK